MIVETMNHVEVYKELEKDRLSVTDWWRHKLSSLRRPMLKRKDFPVMLWFEHISPRKNRYLFCTRIFDKRMKCILTGVLALNNTSEGICVYTNWVGYQKLISPMAILPHFWTRYADPKRGNVQKTGVELIKHYFEHNNHGQDTRNQKCVGRSVRWNGEEHLANCVPEGVMLGQVYDGIFVARTFITYEMSGGLQQQEFESCRKQILTDREMYDEARKFYV